MIADYVESLNRAHILCEILLNWTLLKLRPFSHQNIPSKQWKGEPHTAINVQRDI